MTLEIDNTYVARIWLEMKTILTSFKVAFFICLFCQPASGDTASRISEILSRDNYAPDGMTLTSRRIASVDACFVHVATDRSHTCSYGSSVSSSERLVDVRVLMTDPNLVEIEDLTGTQFESLGASVTFRYQPSYRQSLQFAYNTARQILDEEYARYPEDVTSRLLSLSSRYREEIDPLLYSHSIDKTSYCSGTETTQPLDSYSFRLYPPPEHAAELVNLLDELARQCESGPAS
jgi:hypothetical protein